MAKIIGIGDNVCDKYEHLKLMFPGGQALNVAVYSKMLGMESSYMGVFGMDEVAEHVIATLDELQVEHGHCRQYPGENGCAHVTLVDGDRVFLGSNRGGIAKEKPLDLTEDDLEYIQEFSHVHTSNNSHFDSQLAKVKSTGVSLSYDFSGRWGNWEWVEQVAPYVDYGFLSCGAVTEEEALEICKRMHQAGCKKVIATRGSYGAMFYDGIVCFVQPPKLVEAIDTLGAGDSFAAAFLVSMVRSREAGGDKIKQDRIYYETEVKKALENGAEFSAKTCLVRGAFGHEMAFE